MGQRRNHNLNKKIFLIEGNKNKQNFGNARQQNKPLNQNNNKSEKLIRKKDKNFFSFEKSNKIDKLQARLIKKKREDTYYQYQKYNSIYHYRSYRY